jgi:hypothetical protein
MQEFARICPRCASVFPERAIVCAYCGAQLISDEISKLKGKSSKLMWVLFSILFVGIVFIALEGIYFAFGDRGAVSVKQEESVLSPTSTPPSRVVESEPTSHYAVAKNKPALSPSGLAIGSITPWQLLKNPFLQQGQLVRLDYLRFPTIYNGNVLHYGQCNASSSVCLQMGALGLRFNRTIAPSQVLYDVMGEDTETSVNIAKLGELVVEFGDSEDHPLNHDWVVVPEEPTRGTNAFGASITVATVRYVRLASEGDAPRN